MITPVPRGAHGRTHPLRSRLALTFPPAPYLEQTLVPAVLKCIMFRTNKLGSTMIPLLSFIGSLLVIVYLIDQ
jgi:hypothetical protein